MLPLVGSLTVRICESVRKKRWVEDFQKYAGSKRKYMVILIVDEGMKMNRWKRIVVSPIYVQYIGKIETASERVDDVDCHRIAFYR